MNIALTYSRGDSEQNCRTIEQHDGWYYGHSLLAGLHLVQWISLGYTGMGTSPILLLSLLYRM